MLSGHHRITWRRNIAENLNRLSRMHKRYRRQTDRRQTTDRRTHTTYSEHVHEFTFAKNQHATFRCQQADILFTSDPRVQLFRNSIISLKCCITALPDLSSRSSISSNLLTRDSCSCYCMTLCIL